MTAPPGGGRYRKRQAMARERRRRWTPSPPAPGNWTRRSLLAAAVGSAATLVGCAGDRTDGPHPAFVGTPRPVPQVPGEPGRWRDRTLRVTAFGGPVEDALREHVWDPFAAATGCEIVVMGPDISMLATPAASRIPDLSLASPVDAALAAAAGETVPFDPSLVPAGMTDLAGTSPATLPAFSYALVNARRRGAFPEGAEPVGWPAWWDDAAYPAARTLGRDPLGTLEIALLADGAAIDTLYPLDVDRALSALARIAATVEDRWWMRGIEPVGWLGSSRADLGSAWHHRVIAAQWDGLAVDLSWPGGLLATDRWVVPTGSNQPEVAAEAAAFALLPETQAAFARATRMGPVNPDAFAFIEPWVRPTLPTSPETLPLLARIDGAWWAGHGADARDRFDRWFAARPFGS